VLLWSQSSGSRRPSGDLFKIAHVATFAANNLMLLRRHRRDGDLIHQRSTVGVAVEFDIAAEWLGRQPPMGSIAIIEAKHFRSEAERESVDFNPTPAADQKMSKLAKENHHGQDEEENALISRDRSNMCED